MANRMMSFTAVIQARMGSTRLPGKVLKDLAGQPMIDRVIQRTRRADEIKRVVIATSDRPENDVLHDHCLQREVDCLRGAEEDVLSRYGSVADQFGLTDIVRITGDCPLIDPAVIDRVLRQYRNRDASYASNINPPTFPDGLDVEVLSRSLLHEMLETTDDPKDREHVTRYVRQNPDRFHTVNISREPDLSDLKWSVDEPEDLAFVRAIYDRIDPRTTTYDEIVDLLRENPELQRINMPGSTNSYLTGEFE